MLKLTLENFEEEILGHPGMCLVTFKHGGCHLCRGLSKVLKKLEQEYGEQIKFATVDSMEQKYITNFFEVDGVPTIFWFVDGDGVEIEYPESPNSLSGYGKKYIISFLKSVLDDE